MQDNLSNIGDDVYKTWSYEQRHAEIGKLVEGFKNGLPVQIMCQTAASIAGSPALASRHLALLLTRKERRTIIKKESGSNEHLRALLEATLLQKG